MQIVIAGKAHPADDGGKQLIQQIVRVRRRPGGAAPHRVPARLRHRRWPQLLYPGADVWLNNPLRPLEACGTSGMKAALNGALNLSILDGWWDELYDGENGWAIPSADGVERPRPARRPRGDRAVRPDREAGRAAVLRPPTATGVPGALGRDGAAHAEARSARRCSPTRMVRDYVERLYVPAALAHRALAPDAARELSAWKTRVRRRGLTSASRTWTPARTATAWNWAPCAPCGYWWPWAT